MEDAKPGFSRTDPLTDVDGVERGAEQLQKTA
jgi:hypothetical protein